eukprot:PhF_6_TR34701/c0_g1_i1/m.50496
MFQDSYGASSEIDSEHDTPRGGKPAELDVISPKLPPTTPAVTPQSVSTSELVLTLDDPRRTSGLSTSFQSETPSVLAPKPPLSLNSITKVASTRLLSMTPNVLLKEIVAAHNDKKMIRPAHRPRFAAVMFVDISGYTLVADMLQKKYGQADGS